MGQEVAGEPAHRRIARGLGRTFQIPRPFPELSLMDNMLIARQGQTGERFWANFTAPRRVAAEERAGARQGPGAAGSRGADAGWPTNRRACCRAGSASCWNWRG